MRRRKAGEGPEVRTVGALTAGAGTGRGIHRGGRDAAPERRKEWSVSDATKRSLSISGEEAGKTSPVSVSVSLFYHKF